MTRIAVVEGDGIGHEVIPVAQKVLALLHPEYQVLPGRDGVRALGTDRLPLCRC